MKLFLILQILVADGGKKVVSSVVLNIQLLGQIPPQTRHRDWPMMAKKLK